MEKTIIMSLYLHERKQVHDIEVPLDITANELLAALNQGYHLNIDLQDRKQCCLRTENPIALLKGNRTIEEYGLREGTIINFTGFGCQKGV